MAPRGYQPGPAFSLLVLGRPPGHADSLWPPPPCPPLHFPILQSVQSEPSLEVTRQPWQPSPQWPTRASSL